MDTFIAIIGVILLILIVLVFSGIVLGFLFLPAIIAFQTGNWWYILLFLVSWIPAKYTALLGILIFTLTGSLFSIMLE